MLKIFIWFFFFLNITKLFELWHRSEWSNKRAIWVFSSFQFDWRRTKGFSTIQINWIITHSKNHILNKSFVIFEILWFSQHFKFYLIGFCDNDHQDADLKMCYVERALGDKTFASLNFRLKRSEPIRIVQATWRISKHICISFTFNQNVYHQNCQMPNWI